MHDAIQFEPQLHQEQSTGTAIRVCKSRGGLDPITKSLCKLVQICLLLKLCCGKGHKRGHGGEWPRLERSMTIVPNVICAVPFRGRNGSKEPEVQEDHE